MRCKYWLIIAVVLLLTCSQNAFSQDPAPAGTTGEILRNSDIFAMVKDGVKPGVIIAKIMTSHCNFDVFPPVLQDLRRRGVPTAVLQAMLMAPVGPPNAPSAEKNSAYPKNARVNLPAGTEFVVETLFPASMFKMKEGGHIGLTVVQPVYVDGVLAIPRGAIAKARVAKVIKRPSRNRAGWIYWELEHVVGLDGTEIPAELRSNLDGATRAAQRGNSRFGAIVSSDTEVVGEVSEEGRVIYHYIGALEAKIGTSLRTTTRRRTFRTTARRRR